MTDINDAVSNDPGETVETTGSEPLEVDSSQTIPEGQTEGQEEQQPQGQEVPQPEFDPLKALDALKLDPKVKEALKSGYLRQSDYTKKTQDLATQRGLIEEYTQVRPVLEFLAKNPDLFNQLVEKMGGSQPQGQEIPDDPKAFADWVKAETIKEMMGLQARDRDFQEASLVDPRLSTDPEYGEMIAKMVANDQDFRSGSITAAEATKRAVERFDKYISKQVSTAKTTLSQRAKQKQIGSSTQSRVGGVSPGEKPKTIQEAAAMAEDELTN